MHKQIYVRCNSRLDKLLSIINIQFTHLVWTNWVNNVSGLTACEKLFRTCDYVTVNIRINNLCTFFIFYVIFLLKHFVLTIMWVVEINYFTPSIKLYCIDNRLMIIRAHTYGIVQETGWGRQHLAAACKRIRNDGTVKLGMEKKKQK